MDENIGTGTKKPENTDSLHQMSEDMKLHIAQLKAELGNSDSKSFVSPSTLVSMPVVNLLFGLLLT